MALVAAFTLFLLPAFAYVCDETCLLDCMEDKTSYTCFQGCCDMDPLAHFGPLVSDMTTLPAPEPVKSCNQECVSECYPSVNSYERCLYRCACDPVFSFDLPENLDLPKVTAPTIIETDPFQPVSLEQYFTSDSPAQDTGHSWLWIVTVLGGACGLFVYFREKRKDLEENSYVKL